MRRFSALRAAGLGLVGALAVAAPSHAVAVITPDLVPLVEEGIAVADPLAFGFDAANITLTYDTVVSVIFVSEGAGYRSTFGWYDASLDPTLPTNRNVIWNNASMAGSGGSLNTGDTVTLGSFAAGSAIGFFLTADGFSNASAPTYYTNTPYNPDGGVIHTVSSLLPIEGLVALGFEDLWGGGDRDTTTWWSPSIWGRPTLPRCLASPKTTPGFCCCPPGSSWP